ncbi:MAG: hypothetical protein WAL50_13645 [Kineosporiaceae bacterium]
MTPPDEDRALSVQTAPKPQATPPGASPPGALPAEPMPSETRRLPRAASRPAPVLALLRARWPWLVIAGLLGTVAGLLLGSSQTQASTSVLRLTGINDSFRVKQVGQTYELIAVSPPVIARAAKSPELASVRAARGFTGAKADELYAADLTNRVTALWGTDTDLVSVTVRNTDGLNAVIEANAIQKSVIDSVKEARDQALKDLRAQVETTLGNKLPTTASSSETERQTRLGQLLGDAQMSEILSAASVTVGNKATSYIAAGASPQVSAGLGGAGALLLGALAALVVGAGRRRVRTPNELRSLAPELTLKATTQAGEVAGRLLESGHSTLVVLSLPSTPSSASRFAAAVANHLRTHGSSVTLVNAIALESGDAASMALPDEVWVLRRDIRQDVKAYFSTDVLVVACTAEPEAVGLISGQSDLMAVVVAKEGRSTLRQIWDTVSAVESADPIVVLAP